jgi:hypothetical protein
MKLCTLLSLLSFGWKSNYSIQIQGEKQREVVFLLVWWMIAPLFSASDSVHKTHQVLASFWVSVSPPESGQNSTWWDSRVFPALTFYLVLFVMFYGILSCSTPIQVQPSYFKVLFFTFLLVLFFVGTRVWTQGLHFEPLHQPIVVMGFVKIGSRYLPRLASSLDLPDLCLLSS